MARRTSTKDPFSNPKIVPEVSSPNADAPTFVTRDGCTLYFSIYLKNDQNPYGVFAEYVARRPAL